MWFAVSGLTEGPATLQTFLCEVQNKKEIFFLSTEESFISHILNIDVIPMMST